jgi:putative SOS response-associated peptidase YedK
MCGRFAITLPSDAMAQLFAARPANDLPDVPNYNVCPTTRIHVVSNPDGSARALTAMRWGFLPHWYKALNGGPLLINARAETIAEKPAFKSAARSRRGLIVASGFYEWTKTADGARDPWYITRNDGAPMAMAAVWQDWALPDNANPIRSVAIVTTAANTAMRTIHHRMPVILEEQDWPLWLGEGGHGAARLMTAPSDETLRMHRVDRAVNSNRAQGPQLIAPVET